MEIEVGEYVRTNDGYIGKIIDETRDGGYYMENFEHIILRYNRDFTKHSKNIIDLIEVGDYVNGDRVYKITSSCIYLKGKAPENKHSPKVIETILTHEQYSNNSYKVVE